MNEKTLQLLTDLHINNHRQGPGSDDTVKKILQLSGINRDTKLQIADIGCGTGASTMLLAQELPQAHITAVDFLAPFLEKLTSNVQEQAVSDYITTIEADMADLPFTENQFDVIWSEGAIYNIGFEKGIKEWKRFLKKDGYMVLTEITWLKKDIPEEIKKHWDTEYPEIDFAENKIKILEENGFKMIDCFVLPENCWINEYYTPLENELDKFLERNNDSEEAQQIANETKMEIELYKKYKDYFSYGVYITKKLSN